MSKGAIIAPPSEEPSFDRQVFDAITAMIQDPTYHIRDQQGLVLERALYKCLRDTLRETKELRGSTENGVKAVLDAALQRLAKAGYISLLPSVHITVSDRGPES